MTTKTLARINNVPICLINNEGQKLVPIRPICDALGVDYSTQFTKLKEDVFLSSTVVLSTTVGADKKNRQMACLPIEFVFGWLFTINPKNVHPDARESVANYRIECYRVLYRHFTLQSEFLAAKQTLINDRLLRYEKIRTDFRMAQKRLKAAKDELYKAKDITLEEWEAAEQQLVLSTFE